MAYLVSGGDGVSDGTVGCGSTCGCSACRRGCGLGEADANSLRNRFSYGKYCGWGTRCGKPDCGEPDDDLDRCCQAHDACYTRAGINFLTRRLPWNRFKALRCDVPFCGCVARARVAGLRANAARIAAMGLFCPRPGIPPFGF